MPPVITAAPPLQHAPFEPVSVSSNPAGSLNATQAPLGRQPIDILVTGFGPFTNIPVNPSWEALKPLHGHTFVTQDGTPVRLHCEEIPVVYDEVLARIPAFHALPSQTTPQARMFDIFIHVGVSPSRSYVSIESQARRLGYERPDFHNQLCRSAIDEREGKLCHGFVEPEWDVAPSGELSSLFDIQGMAQFLKQRGVTDMQVSHDAGLFLCEFVYYASLASARRVALATGQPEKPVVFLHVPNENEPYTLPQLTQIVLDLASCAANAR